MAVRGLCSIAWLLVVRVVIDNPSGASACFTGLTERVTPPMFWTGWHKSGRVLRHSRLSSLPFRNLELQGARPHESGQASSVRVQFTVIYTKRRIEQARYFGSAESFEELEGSIHPKKSIFIPLVGTKTCRS